MTTDSQAARCILPPYFVLHDFLRAKDADGLLSFAVEHRDSFAPAKTGLGAEGALRTHIRSSEQTRELGAFADILREALLPCLPELCVGVGLSPFVPDGIALQLVAHGDGGFYKRHIDTATTPMAHRLRVLTAVYYVHRRPKIYQGGALRLHAIGGGETFVDVQPAHNMLVVFPAFAPHEVLPVRCPSEDFADRRFSVNCWAYRSRTPV